MVVVNTNPVSCHRDYAMFLEGTAARFDLRRLRTPADVKDLPPGAAPRRKISPVEQRPNKAHDEANRPAGRRARFGLFWTVAEHDSLRGEWTGQSEVYRDGLLALGAASIAPGWGSRPSSAPSTRGTLGAWSLTSNASSETKQGTDTRDATSGKHYESHG